VGPFLEAVFSCLSARAPSVLLLPVDSFEERCEASLDEGPTTRTVKLGVEVEVGSACAGTTLKLSTDIRKASLPDLGDADVGCWCCMFSKVGVEPLSGSSLIRLEGVVVEVSIFDYIQLQGAACRVS